MNGEHEQLLDDEYQRALSRATDFFATLAREHREAGLEPAQIHELWWDALADAREAGLAEAFK